MIGSKFDLRMVVEGGGVVWTTYPANGDTSHGRRIRGGLLYDGLELSERADIRGGKTELTTMTIQIVASDDANEEFSRRATLLTFLDAPISSVGATTMEVRSNALLADGDFVHVGTECVEVVDASTNSVEIARTRRNTLPQVHLLDRTGVTPREIPVWNLPQAWEGRRVYLYLREWEGHESLIFRGVITQEPYLASDGTTWSIDVQHVGALLNREIGAALDVSARLVGRKHGTDSAFGMTVWNGTTRNIVAQITGLWLSDDEFIGELQGALDAYGPVVAGTENWRCGVERASFGFGDVRAAWIAFDVQGADVAPPSIDFGSFVDGFRSQWEPFYETAGGQPVHMFSGTMLEANKTYRMNATGFQGVQSPWLIQAAISATYGSGTPMDPCHALYVHHLNRQPEPYRDPTAEGNDITLRDSVILDADIGAVVGDTLIFEGASLPDSSVEVELLTITGQVYRYYGAELAAHPDIAARGAFYADADTVVRARKNMGRGSLADLRDAVVAASPWANHGAVPFVTADDLEDWRDVVDQMADGMRLLTTRKWTFDEPKSLRDVIAPELQMLCCVMRVGAGCKIGVVPLTRPTPTTIPAFTIEPGDIVTPGGGAGRWPEWVPATEGVVSGVSLVIDGEPLDVYRDVVSVSAHKNTGASTLKIEPLASRTDEAPVDMLEAMTIAERLVNVFGQPYETVTLQVFRHKVRGVLVGDVIALNSPHVPNTRTGRRGVSQRRATVIGKREPLDPANGAGVIDLEMVLWGESGSGPGGLTNFAGYTPTMTISAGTNVSANVWELTCNLVSNFAPPSSTVPNFFEAGYHVLVREQNTAPDNAETGVVTLIDGDTVRIDFGGNPAPWGGTFSGAWLVSYANALTGQADNQAAYCYVADGDGVLADGNPARVFA